MEIAIIIIGAILVAFFLLRAILNGRKSQPKSKSALRQYILSSHHYMVFQEFQKDWEVKLAQSAQLVRTIKYSSEKEYHSQTWEYILNKILIAQDLDIDFLMEAERKRMALYRQYEEELKTKFMQQSFIFEKNKKENEEYNKAFHAFLEHNKFKHQPMKIVVHKVCIGLNNLKSSKEFGLTEIEKMWELIDKKIVMESSYWQNLMQRLYEYKHTIRIVPQLETTFTYSSIGHMNEKTFDELAYEYCLTNSVDAYRILNTENFNKTALSAYLTEVERVLSLPLNFVPDTQHNLRCKRLFRKLIEQHNGHYIYKGQFSLTIHKKLEGSAQVETKVYNIVETVRLFGG